MSKTKFVLSPADKLSILIATIALISTLFTIYIQFFYRVTNLQIGSTTLTSSQDTLSRQLDIDVLLLNSGTNPVAVTGWYSFLSADRSLTGGTCYNNIFNLENTALYTYGCGSDINEVIAPNNVQFIDLELVINIEMLDKFSRLNTSDNSEANPYFSVGIHMSFVDSSGQKVDREFIIGMVQFLDDRSVVASFNNDSKNMIIY